MSGRCGKAVDDAVTLAGHNANPLLAAPRLFEACVAAIPYAPAAAFLGREKGKLAQRDGEPLRVALVADGVGGMHGVTHTLEEIQARGVPGFDVEVIGTDPCVDRRLPAVREVDIPFYAGLQVGVPSLPAIVEALAEGRYDVVHLCSPGPCGVAAAVIARVMEKPVLGSYHTELATYARLRSGDGSLGRMATQAIAAFYGSCDHVLSPSPASDAVLRELGIAPDRIGRWDRGVDLGRFSPANRVGGPPRRRGQRPLRGPADAREGRRPAGRDVPRGAPPRPAAAPEPRGRRARGGPAARAARRPRDVPRLARGRGAGARLRERRRLPVLLADRHVRAGAARGPGERPAGRRGRRGRAVLDRQRRRHRAAATGRRGRARRRRSPTWSGSRSSASAWRGTRWRRWASGPGRPRSAASPRATAPRSATARAPAGPAVRPEPLTVTRPGGAHLRLVTQRRLRVVDVALFYGERSGGIRTYLDAKRAWDGPWAHAVITPHDVPSLRFATPNGYRIPVGVGAMKEALREYEPDVVLLHDPFWGPLGVTRTAHELGARVVAVHHGSAELDAAGLRVPDVGLRAAAAPLVPPRLPRRRRDHGGRPDVRDARRVADVPLRFGLDPAFRPPEGAQRGDHVLYVGRLAREKGVFRLLEAAARSRDPWPLWLMGSGPARAQLLAHARRLGIARRVSLRPYADDRSELARAYASARCVVMPGEHETFGLVGFEAAASGASVVCCSTAPSARARRGPRGDVPARRHRRAGPRDRDRPASDRPTAPRPGRSPTAPPGMPRSAPSIAHSKRSSPELDALAEGTLRANWREGIAPDGVVVRVHVPGAAALPPHVALGLVLPRRRVDALRPGPGARRAADGAAQRARRRLPAAHGLLGPAGGLAARAAVRDAALARRPADALDRPAAAAVGVGAVRRRPRRPARARRAPRLARPRARPRRRRPAHDRAARRVRPRRLAEVRPGLRGRWPTDSPGYARLLRRCRQLGWRSRAIIAATEEHVEDVLVNVAYALSLRAMARMTGDAAWDARADRTVDALLERCWDPRARALLGPRRPRRGARPRRDVVVARAARAAGAAGRGRRAARRAPRRRAHVRAPVGIPSVRPVRAVVQPALPALALLARPGAGSTPPTSSSRGCAARAPTTRPTASSRRSPRRRCAAGCASTTTR